MKKILQFKKIKPAGKVAPFIISCLVLILILSQAYIFTSCKSKEVSPDTTASSPQTTQQAQQTQATEKPPETTAQATETAEEIPDEITGLIEEADDYYLEGEFGLARSTYRKAEIAIDKSKLTDITKQELLDSFYEKFTKAADIVEKSRVHFGNAMQLQYEQRYEEAKKELEAALAIYPKYEAAVEAYENLKAVMGLK